MGDPDRGLIASVRVLATVAVLCLLSTPSAEGACLPGSHRCPIRLRLRAQAVAVKGALSPQRLSVSYSFRARAGQSLVWSLSGPTAHATITYPDGNSDGPDLPETLPLPQTGAYTFTISANRMAENAFGPFQASFALH